MVLGGDKVIFRTHTGIIKHGDNSFIQTQMPTNKKSLILQYN